MRASWAASAAASIWLGVLITQTAAFQNYTRADSLQSLLDDRPDGCPQCPSCFDCNKESDTCTQFASCKLYNGKCSCPAGFGGDDCALPLCGSLADGNNRAPRADDTTTCECGEGWKGINCNVCTADTACNALMPDQTGGVCHSNALVVKENYQMCNVTNRKILDQLKEQIPQVTFSCNAEEATCSFQCEFCCVAAFCHLLITMFSLGR